MKRLLFDFLDVEITRRCNIKCAHCFRGDAQNIDMSNDIIDSLLDATDEICNLNFIGGEPTLNIDGMNHFLDKVIANKIELHNVNIVINGTQSEEFCGFIKRLDNYLNSYDHGENISGIMIDISADVYHKAQGIDAKDAYDFYNDKIGYCTRLKLREEANFPENKGRAKNLEYAMKIIDARENQAVEYYTTKHKHYCVVNANFYKDDVEDNQIVILCRMLYTAKGNIIKQSITSIGYSYEEVDNMKPVFDLNKDMEIENQIEIYNKGRTRCIENQRFGFKRAIIMNMKKLKQDVDEDVLKSAFDAMMHKIRISNYKQPTKKQQETMDNYLQRINDGKQKTKEMFEDFKSTCTDKRQLMLYQVKEDYPNVPDKLQIELANSLYALIFFGDMLSTEVKNTHLKKIDDIVNSTYPDKHAHETKMIYI